METEFWSLTVTCKDEIGYKQWSWSKDKEDYARLIFKAYKNTILRKSHEIHDDGDDFLHTDYGTVKLAYIVPQEPHNEKPAGMIYMPYITNIF